jgi:hypothetical protein
MATRENQGLQIALIIFLMITVGLAISTYYFFRQAEEMATKERDATAKMLASDTKAKSLNAQLVELKYMVGVPNITDQVVKDAKAGVAPDEGSKEIDRIRADFVADMSQFDDTVPPDARNWRLLPRFLLSSLMKRNTEVDTLVIAERKAMTDKDVEVKAEQAAVVVAKEGQTKAAADVEQVRTTFTTEVQNANKLKGELEAAVDKTRKELAEQTAKLTTQIKTAEDTVKDLRQAERGLSGRLKELTNESFERPHGQVTWVNQRNKTCYINLGRADGLQRQVTFSVYDNNINTLEVPDATDERKKGKKKDESTPRKASIEVSEILEDHLAECRILDDSIKNPILPGDQLFTPAWRPGQKLQFALVGRMNIDNDREDDRQKVRNMIESNGGEIVAEVLDNGKLEGKISVNTRFLVIGDRPEDASDDKVRASFNDIIGAAERNGVQQISIRDLVAMMGYKGTDRTVTLGRGGAGDIEKKPEAKEGFRPRPKPAAAGANGAFE